MVRSLYRQTMGSWTSRRHANRRFRPWSGAGILGAFLGLALWTAQANEPNWRERDGYRWRELSVAEGGSTGFTELPASTTRITFANALSEEDGAANRVLWNGSGLAVGDYDRDGLPDVFFCGLGAPNVLYRNLGGWRFQDVTAESGLAFSGKHYRGAVFADIDGDGWLDLLVSANGRGVLCYRNLGGGKFAEATDTAGTGSGHGSGTLALADFNGDGALDLYVCNYRIDDIRDQGEVTVQQRNGQLVVPDRYRDRLLFRDNNLIEYGEPDQWLVNDGQGRFKEAPWASGKFLDELGEPLTAPPLDWGLTATFRDVDNNGLPDLYVCNDYWTPDRFWINQGGGVFRAIAHEGIRHLSASAMTVDFADIDSDGLLDFFVADMLSRDASLRKRQMVAQLPEPTSPGDPRHRPQVARNTLFRQRPDGTFEEIAHYAGVAASDWSWSAVFMDVDLDGDEDLLIAAGHFKDVQDRDAFAEIQSRQRPRHGATLAERQRQFREELTAHYRLYPYLPMPVVAFRNEGNRRFSEVTEEWGTGSLGVHHAMASGDFDGDGDLDFMVNNLDQPAGVFRNTGSAPRIAVRLRGKSPNTQAVGAKVTLEGKTFPPRSLEVVAGGRYLSGSDPLLVFGARTDDRGLKLRVIWPDQTESLVEDVMSDRLYEIDEVASQKVGRAVPSAPSSSPESPSQFLRVAGPSRSETLKNPLGPMFEDRSAALSHAHHQLAINDYLRQPLLPFKLSQLGPGIAWFDIDGDGRDDLICGSGRAGDAVILRQVEAGFQRTGSPGLRSVSGDITGVLGWRAPSGTSEILLAVSAYASPQTNAVLRSRFHAGQITPMPPLRNLLAGSGALAITVLDVEGTTALFTGGQVLPGGYPLGGGSLVYRRVTNAWSPDRQAIEALRQAGLVNGALFTDLDGDGQGELVLACEWGPIRVFSFSDQGWVETTKAWGLDRFTGLWKGLASVDLNNDGRMDLVAGNLGLNTYYQAAPEKPLLFYYGDIAETGSMAIIETEYDERGRIVPSRPLHVLAQSLPFLSARFDTIRAYSEANITEVLGEGMGRALQARATTLESMVFLNQGRRFAAHALPYEAQIAPVFGVVAADFDADGNEDVFLSQNFFETRVDEAPWDAGRGLLLLGDGSGSLKPIEGRKAGIRIYGAQRGAAVADYDRDGRVDLVVAQNGGATRLFRNVNSQSGLRVRLNGPSGNPLGIGARVRVVYAEGLGPAREIRAGGGYWSQDSPVVVLGLRSDPVALRVTWPGGKETTHPLTGRPGEIKVSAGGSN